MTRLILTLLSLMMAFSYSFAQSYTVNIDDVSRVDIFFMENGENILAEGFHSGENIIEIGNESAVIFTPSSLDSKITRVNVQYPDGADVDMYQRADNSYWVFVHPGIADAYITVESEECKAPESVTATIIVDNADNLRFCQFGKQATQVDLENGENIVSFIPELDNPLTFEISWDIDYSIPSILLNGEVQRSVYPMSTYFSVTLSANDVLEILTEGSTVGLVTVTDSATVVSEEYYDMNGHRLREPVVNGIYVVKRIMENGKVATEKKIAM